MDLDTVCDSWIIQKKETKLCQNYRILAPFIWFKTLISFGGPWMGIHLLVNRDFKFYYS